MIALLLPRAFAFSYTGAKSWSAPLGFGAAGGAAILGVILFLRRAPQWLAVPAPD